MSTVTFSCRDVDALDADRRYQKALSAGKTTAKRTNDLPLGLQFGQSPAEVNKQLIQEVFAGRVLQVGRGYSQPMELAALPGKAEISYQLQFDDQGGSRKLVGMNFSITYTPTAAEAADDGVSAQKAFFREVTNQFRLDYAKSEFFSIPDPDFWRVITQVNNNRRLDFFRKNRNVVLGQFTDLSVNPNAPLLVESHR